MNWNWARQAHSGDAQQAGLEQAFVGVAGVERVQHHAAGAASGKGSCSSLMKRRFIGKATSTPRMEMTTIQIIICHQG